MAVGALPYGVGMTEQTELKDPRFTAAIDLLRRTGAHEVQIRHSDETGIHDELPVVWTVAVGWNVDGEGAPVPEAEATGMADDAGAAMAPLNAVLRMCAQVVDGGKCAHYQRPAGFEPKSLETMPLDRAICW